MKALWTTMLALAALALTSTLAEAASSDWYQTQGGRVRLVVLPEQSDGKIPALLDVQLEPGWKTYWRDPGASGIPPSISLPKESGLTLDAIHFPVPRHFDDGFSRYAAYDHSVAFPLTLKRTGTQLDKLTASIFLGMCKDICIPVQAELSVSLATAKPADSKELALVAAAEAELPKPPSTAFAVEKAQWSADGKNLSITFKAPEPLPGTMPQVFVSGPDGFQFGVGSAVRNEGAYSIDVPLLHKPKTAGLAGAPILFTAESGGHAMETPLAID